MNREMEIMKKLGLAALAILLLFGTISVSASESANKNVDDKKLLVELGVPVKSVNRLMENDLELIADVIRNEKLTVGQAKSLVETWHDQIITDVNQFDLLDLSEKTIALDRIEQIKVKGKQENNTEFSATEFSTLAVNTYTDYIKSTDYTGAHWQVKSMTGYNKTSGNIDLPTVYSAPSIANKDVPYMFFGFYSGTTLGLDLGFQYIRDFGWRPFIYGYDYTKPSGSQNVTIHGNYTTTVPPYTYPNSKNFNLVAKLTKYTTYDEYQLTIIDRTDWMAKETLIYRTGKPIANTSYTNVAINREVTLAFNSDPNRQPNTGSYLRDAKWSNVYLYNNTWNGLWDSTRTASAYRMGKDTSFINSITVKSYTAWYQDVIDINY